MEKIAVITPISHLKGVVELLLTKGRVLLYEESTKEEVREMLYKSYGRKCRYCSTTLVVANMACDHVYPLSMGGDSTIFNLQMICQRCNTRKGPLTHKNFRRLLMWLKHQDKDLEQYVLRKMSSRDF